MSFSLLAVVGPTASGKTALALELAAALENSGQPVEIINADAMQLYAGMDIGTAKLSIAERSNPPHHLFDILTPAQEMTAVEYQRVARETCLEIIARGKLPIFVGGSMFYLAAALDQLDFAPTDVQVRLRLEQESASAGALAMHERLRKLDPVTADKIPAQNVRRVIRALEVIEITGESYASTLPEPRYWKPALQIGLAVDREELKRRILLRVEAMWQQGITREVEQLLAQGELGKTARMAIGYKQAIAQLNGELSQAEAMAETVALTNRYARRQMSWFRRDKRIGWISANEPLIPQALNLIRLGA
ncbi:MAG: tRNA ((37)-N6)-dimethylallyltransferase MiaA [Actinomycetota bacterium]